MRRDHPHPPHRHAGKRGDHPPRSKPPTPTAATSKETHWADVADWYDRLVGDEGSEYHQHVVLPGVMRLLNLGPSKQATPKPKLRVLDLACGQGVLCRRLAAEGCTVIGLDAAAPLIDAARRRNETEKLLIDYGVADATKLVDDTGTLSHQLPNGLTPNSLDAVTIILAIQNITPLSPVWQGCRALLKPGGSLIIVMMHPCFRVPRQSDWLWEEHTQSQARLIRQYLSSEKVDIQTHPGQAAHGKSTAATPHFHRPLQAYINTLGNAGLLIDHVDEWISHKTSQAGPRKAALDRSRKEIPLFLALRAKKI